MDSLTHFLSKNVYNDVYFALMIQKIQHSMYFQTSTYASPLISVFCDMFSVLTHLPLEWYTILFETIDPNTTCPGDSQLCFLS